MKFAFIIPFALLISCSQSAQNQIQEKTEPTMDWLLGDWVRTNGQPGEHTFEHWSKTNEGFICNAFTIVNEDTVFQERIDVYLSDNIWQYKVSGPNDTAVIFSATSISDSNFICENLKHDFPKIITYDKDGDCIAATISDGSTKEILFRYEREH
ncbi:MAG: hypothetical protein COA58_12000 [Bacteroidetes bacterium]|nr:MAG: hypothetical protein COA58_12000 [Bacteroidota bacterium]